MDRLWKAALARLLDYRGDDPTTVVRLKGGILQKLSIDRDHPAIIQGKALVMEVLEHSREKTKDWVSISVLSRIPELDSSLLLRQELWRQVLDPDTGFATQRMHRNRVHVSLRSPVTGAPPPKTRAIAREVKGLSASEKEEILDRIYSIVSKKGKVRKSLVNDQIIASCPQLRDKEVRDGLWKKALDPVSGFLRTRDDGSDIMLLLRA